MKKFLYGALLLAVPMLFASCGGGGGEDSGARTSVAPATVALVITDASTDEWDQALATITSVSLIDGDGGHELLFSGEKTVDLLSLREHLKLFFVKERVKPGYYSKIRLQIKKLVLVKNHDVGLPTEQDVKVPSGKVDLNPKGTFYIAPGSAMFASLDWDMEKSLKFIETGSGKWIMRPVIFVDIGTKPMFKKGLARLFGTVESVATDASSFLLCSGSTTSTATPLASGDDNKEWCVDVLVTDKTGLFDSNGEPKAVRQVVTGEEVTVLGLLRRDDHDDDHDEDDDDDSLSKLSDDDDDESRGFQVVAIVVESGAEGTWKQLRGAMTSVVDADNRFSFDPDSGQGFDDTTLLTGQLFLESRVFRVASDGSITEVAPGDLAVNDRAAFDAVQLLPGAAGDPDLNIAVMLTRPPLVATNTVTGTISRVEASGDKIWLNGDADCVTTDMSKVFLLSDTGGVNEGTVDDLRVGSPAVVTGSMYNGCLQADVIVSQTPASP